jgi:uncharacterized membrane protein SpoIIM required for sporulation
MVRVWDLPGGELLPALVVTAAAFSLGGILGCALALSVSGGGGDSLSSYVSGYLAAAQSTEMPLPGVLSTAWSVARWPLLTVLMGFTAIGLIGIPVLFATRGFLLSFAISAFIQMFGIKGGLLAFLTFGLTGILSVPALFVLGVQGMLAARVLLRRFSGSERRVLPFDRAYFTRCGLCACALTLCVLLELFGVPMLIRSVSGLFV